MSDPSSAPSVVDELLTQFLQEYDAAPTDEARDAIVRRWKANHPHLAEEVRDLAAMRQRLPRAEDVPDPTDLPDFHIVGLIGRGGMGKVYKARQLSLGRDVALKVARGRLSPDRQVRFLREQRVLARLHQTHIVPIHAAGQHGPWQYFAMAYIEGTALSHLVRSTWQRESSRSGGKTPTLAELAGKSLSVRTTVDETVPENGELAAAESSRRLLLSQDYFRSVARVIADAAEALQHAHDAGILHRDVKPGNLLVDRSGQCWLIDFGLARTVAGSEASGGCKPPDGAPHCGVYPPPARRDGADEGDRRHAALHGAGAVRGEGRRPF